MKRFFTLYLTALVMLSGCAEINDRLDGLEQTVDAIQNTQIATIQQQISAINSSLPKLEQANEDLKDYILSLQKRASELEVDIKSTNDRIAALKQSLEGEIDDEVARAIALLEAAKSDIQSELATINGLIANLQRKDIELEGRIASLQKYVDGELSDMQDWTTATFATLEQYNELAKIVASIDIDAKTVNSLLVELEERINEKLAEATKGLKGEIADAVTDITRGYTDAISAARDDITAAYNKAIKSAIDDVVVSIKSWVNTQLANYYTIAEADAKLETLKIALESKITASENSIKESISELEIEINTKISENGKLISALENDLSTLTAEAAKNANNIITNANAIEVNAESIRKNAQAILDNDADIEANAALIADNKSLIAANNNLIGQNQAAIAKLQGQVSANEQAIVANATTIAKNAADISANAAQIANNAAAIADNLAAITANSADIATLQDELIKTTKEITQAYKNAISNAITSLNGELRDHIASEVATINTAIEALTARVAALEKEVKNIKVAIYNIQGDIAALQEQVAAILARIQSISFVPKYADGNATMYYTNSNGTITAGNATLDFELQPASTAAELVSVWESALSAKAVYTMTRSAGDFVNLTIESATAKDGILTVVVSGANLNEAFFRSEISANVRLQVSDGNNQLASEYVNMVPWTIDNIAFTDANFKAVLLENYDANSDGEISAEEAAAVTSLDVSGTIPQITSLEGIEYFTNLESLDCSYNKIASLDLANNTKLTTVLAATNSLESVALPASVTTLDLSNNKLSTVDVSKMKGLTSLNLSINKLASLNVSQNKQLTSLLCLKNELVSLDVANLTLLTELNCSNNHIESLNLSKNTALTTLDVSKNALTTLDITKCNLLVEFACNDNSLTKLYLGNQPSLPALNCSANNLAELSLAGCSALTDLDCSKNALSALNIVPASKLQTLNCSTNALAMLDISNNALLATLDCSENPNLVKLWVKDEAQQGAVAITKDDTTTIYFNNGGLYIPDAALKAYLVNNYDDNGDSEISIVEADNITMVNCSGKGVTDLTGLEACTNLATLNCSNNSIKKIELPNLLQLRTLTCNDNPIEHINLDNCSALNYLNLQGTPSSAISSTAITITNYKQANTLYFTVKNTPFTSFTVENTPTLTDLEFYGEFTDVTVTDNTALTSLVFYSPAVNVTLSGNRVLESIDVSTLLQLETLDVHKCKLQLLDVTKNLALTSLNCSDNAFTSIDLSQNTELVTLVADNLALNKINLSTNTKLAKYSFTGNPNLTNIRVCPGFTMDNCLFTSAGNNPSLSIFNTAGNTFFYVGQYSTTFGSGGVVYTISNSGQNGKMVSVEEIRLAWSTEYINTNARNQDDGMANMNTIKAINPDLSKYPAFKWCADYGTDWYLPAFNELKVIYENKSIINSTLSKCGFKQLQSSSGDYASSTEGDSSCYYESYFERSSWQRYATSKSDESQIRAILAF